MRCEVIFPGIKRSQVLCGLGKNIRVNHQVLAGLDSNFRVNFCLGNFRVTVREVVADVPFRFFEVLGSATMEG